MTPSVYQLLPYVVAMLPLATAAVITAFWWSALARPWMFYTLSVAGLYGVIAVALFTAILVGPTTDGYFLEPARPDSPRSSSLLGSLDIGVVLGLIVFLAVGCGVLWVLRIWLSKP